MAIKSSYGATAHEVCELFSDYVEGSSERPALAVGTRPPSPAIRNALERSLEAFGYEPDTCTYVSLVPNGEATEPAATASTGAPATNTPADEMLDPHALFVLIEGLDPLHVIATDEAATAALAQTYRTNFAVDSPIRIFGRQSAAFANLDALLETPEGKQRAWKVLKALR